MTFECGAGKIAKIPINRSFKYPYKERQSKQVIETILLVGKMWPLTNNNNRRALHFKSKYIVF